MALDCLIIDGVHLRLDLAAANMRLRKAEREVAELADERAVAQRHNASLVEKLREANERNDRLTRQVEQLDALRDAERDAAEMTAATHRDMVRAAVKQRAALQAKLDQVRNLASTATNATADGDLARCRLIAAYVDGYVHMADDSTKREPTQAEREEFWGDPPARRHDFGLRAAIQRAVDEQAQELLREEPERWIVFAHRSEGWFEIGRHVAVSNEDAVTQAGELPGRSLMWWHDTPQTLAAIREVDIAEFTVTTTQTTETTLTVEPKESR